MLMLIFEVNDENEVVGLNPKSFEVWRTIVGQEIADAYRRKMHEEIIPRIYFDEMPGEVIAILSIATPIIS